MKKYILSFLFMVSLLASGQVFADDAITNIPELIIDNVSNTSATVSFSPTGRFKINNESTVNVMYTPFFVATPYNTPAEPKTRSFSLSNTNNELIWTTIYGLEPNTQYTAWLRQGGISGSIDSPYKKTFTTTSEKIIDTSLKAVKTSTKEAEIFIVYGTRFIDIIHSEKTDNIYLVATYYEKPKSAYTEFKYKVLQKSVSSMGVRGPHPEEIISLSNLKPNTEYEVVLSIQRVMGCAPYIPLSENQGCNTVPNQELANSGTFTFKTLPSQNQSQSQTLTQKLKLGSRGEQVKILEQFLFDGGYLDITPDTYFGTSTRKAVQAFQREQGMTPDGSVGPKTRSIINGLLDK